MKIIADNKKARFDYSVISTYECGFVLLGSEVVAIRQGKINLKDSFVRIIKGEAWLLDAHIGHLKTTNKYFHHDERRARKLLLHKEQIDKLLGKVSVGGLSMLILNCYFSKGILKGTLALVKGKNLHDKRMSIKQRDLNRELRAYQ
ncbi:SsrA-binding protein SmpB [Campylobacter canadensis]|uniref:SsrA-binding protein n=1 Tax=Campylobacter canadensis TaxID=449520 RepID=A0ABS7WSW7_9BACT|nr:SsrA-binding protein SmpB [Campylobacter canadensis]MBZ7987471.1 SsrA-binding protein SmpB [Campylobacter canadensis]MBZ7998435.1 SsrA-binding protein SmpB [Campylobacter canadensis]